MAATLAERIAGNQAAIDKIESGAQSATSEGQALVRATLRDLYDERRKLLREQGWAEPGSRRTIYES